MMHFLSAVQHKLQQCRAARKNNVRATYVAIKVDTVPGYWILSRLYRLAVQNRSYVTFCIRLDRWISRSSASAGVLEYVSQIAGTPISHPATGKACSHLVTVNSSHGLSDGQLVAAVLRDELTDGLPDVCDELTADVKGIEPMMGTN